MHGHASGPAVVAGYVRRPAGLIALRRAADLAARLDAHLHVVHVADLRDYPSDPERHDWEARGGATLTEVEQQVRTLLHDHQRPWTYHPGRGDPVQILLRVAADHDALMLVIGATGIGVSATFRHLLQGSVSHGLLSRGDVPVLLVPAPGPDGS